MSHAGWSAATRSAWGKSDRGQDDGRWLPLHQHLEDSAAIAGILWDHWVPAPIKRLIAKALPEGEADAKVLYQWLAGIHDVGKATPAFAAQVEDLTSRMRDAGLTFAGCSPRSSRDVPHSVAGQLLLTQWLVGTFGANRRLADTYSVIIGGHHGMPPENHALTQAHALPDLIGRDTWRNVHREIFTTMSDLTGATARLAQWLQRPLPPTVQVLLTGLVIIADWLASDETRFPYSAEQTAGERAQLAWQGLGMPPAWSAIAPSRDPAVHLSTRFPVIAEHGAHPSQIALLNAAWELPEPGIVVLEAPMGQGKTEAALAAAEVLAHRWGCTGLYVALPTMATSDAMFSRVHKWISTLPTEHDQTVSIHLAHGASHLNETYQGMFKRNIEIAGIYDEAYASDAGSDEHKELVAVVDSWLQGRKKGLLADFVVGTIDHILMAALKMKHLVLRHTALASKVVVVDEVHAADAYMRVYLHRALQWLGAYGVPVVVLSATLPSGQRAELLDAYAQGQSRRTAPASSPTDLVDSPTVPIGLSYPVVTAQAGSYHRQIPVDTDTSTNRTIQIRQIDEFDEAGAGLIPVLREALAEGGCVAVVRNTVRRAQDTFVTLQQEFGDDVILLHSRFIATDRARKEDSLRAELGPPYLNSVIQRPPRRIVVATQVIEQSLDVDFDLMISDLAPIDLLMQRSGRLHRHHRARPLLLQQPTFLVTGADWRHEPPVPVKGSVSVYQLAPLLRAAAVLHTETGTTSVVIPHGIADLIESAYGESIPGPAQWSSEISNADSDFDVSVKKSIEDAKNFLLGNVPTLGSSLTGWLRASSRDDDHAARAQVRDSEDGLEVMVVQRRSDGLTYVMPGARSHAGEVIPDLQGEPPRGIAQAVAQCTIRLPQVMTAWGGAKRIITELESQRHDSWQQSRWLQGELVLHLDDDFCTTVGGWQLSYDDDFGLLHQRIDQDS